MMQQYFQPDPWLAAVRNALKPRLILTMSASVLAAVVIFGIFRSDDTSTFSGILSSFLGGIGALVSLLFGLTALAHQLSCQLRGVFVPNALEAARFAWGRIRSIVMLPVWAIGLLLALILLEVVLLSLANIPGLGLVWLAVIGVPFLLLNTVVAIALMLALFNMAARVAIANADTDALKKDLWHMLKERLPELLIYNLGGVLVTIIIAALVLSPLWLGAQITFSLVDYAAPQPYVRVSDAIGFWGSIAHLAGLVMLGMLLAAVVSVPGIVITQMTLLVHMELESGSVPDKSESSADEVKESKRPSKPARKRVARPKKKADKKEGAAPAAKDDEKHVDG